jgi:hypothetical protein
VSFKLIEHGLAPISRTGHRSLCLCLSPASLPLDDRIAKSLCFMRVRRTAPILTLNLHGRFVNENYAVSTGILWFFQVFADFWPNFVENASFTG